MPKYGGKQIFSHGSLPEVGIKVEGREEEEKERRKKVGENNGQLRFVRHHGWCTQAHLDQNYLIRELILLEYHMNLSSEY